jgi:hypothetical protein
MALVGARLASLEPGESTHSRTEGGRRAARIHQGELHEARISHPDAGRRAAVHLRVHAEGAVPALSRSC